MKIIECPRDAMQGFEHFISTEQKVAYINALLKVGFDTIDFGSFVSPKVIPQMADTWKVVSRLDLEETDTKLLAIVANVRGAETAIGYERIDTLGFPFSVSETFQLRNTNATQQKAFDMVKQMQELCVKNNKELVVYLSMCFGNPYNDFWDIALVEHWIDRLDGLGIETISLSDTIGVATPDSIKELVRHMYMNYSHIEFGVHLHTEAHNWKEKVEAAYLNGCSRFDGAIKGFGGCPMAQNNLVGNMPTERLIEFFQQERADFFLDTEAFKKAEQIANEIFMVNA